MGLKVLSLFSGIGAFEKALTNLNIPYDLIGYSEIDKYASKSYATVHNIDESMNLGDITKINEKELPKNIDLCTYGFPCVDISTAGKQKGFYNEDGTHTRSGLFFEALRIIKETQPKIAIAENVKALTSKKFEKEFKIVLDSLEEVGYNNYWKVLNAKDYGVPQNRERVFIISIRKDINNDSFKFPEPIKLNLRLKDILEDEVDKKFYLSEKQIDNININNIKSNQNKELSVVNPLKNKTEYGWHFEQNVYDVNGITRTLKAGGGSGNIPKIIEDKKEEPKINVIGNYSPSGHDASRVVDNNGLSPTVKENHGTITATLHNSRMRKLTPKECWRLMGFDDEDFEKAEKVNSNTQLYKQAGNSIVVDILQYIFESLIESRIL